MRTIDENDSVENALLTLQRWKLLSLPVRTRDREGKLAFKGLVGVADVIHAIVFDPAFARYESEYSIRRMTQTELRAIMDVSILKRRVSTLTGRVVDTRYLWTFKSTDKMAKIVEFFARGTHRVLIHRPEASGGLCVLSQSDAVRYLNSNLNNPHVYPKSRRSLEDLGLGCSKRKMVTLGTGQTAIAGFRKLLSTSWASSGTGSDWALGALPVVDAKGKVVATLSQADLRGLGSSNLEEMLLPVLDYLKKRNGGRIWTPICVSPSTTLGICIRKLCSARIHRLWVVDDGKLVGALSLSDILSVYSPYDFSFLSYYQSPMSKL